MTHRLTLTVAAGLALLFAAPRAHAGFSFQNPVSSEACGPIDVRPDMDDPNTFELSGHGITFKQCVGACRLGGAHCKQTVRDNFACQDGVEVRTDAFLGRACDVDDAGNPQSARQCRGSEHSNVQAERAVLREGLSEALANCAQWQSECLDDCQGLE